jgi:hypothetical protein
MHFSRFSLIRNQKIPRSPRESEHGKITFRNSKKQECIKLCCGGRVFCVSILLGCGADSLKARKHEECIKPYFPLYVFLRVFSTSQTHWAYGLLGFFGVVVKILIFDKSRIFSDHSQKTSQTQQNDSHREHIFLCTMEKNYSLFYETPLSFFSRPKFRNDFHRKFSEKKQCIKNNCFFATDFYWVFGSVKGNV